MNIIYTIEPSAISHASSNKRLSTNRARQFTKAEMKVLRDFYHLVGPHGCAKMLPGRSANTVRKKANKMHLEFVRPKKKKPVFLTPEEIEAPASQLIAVEVTDIRSARFAAYEAEQAYKRALKANHFGDMRATKKSGLGV